MKAERLDEIEDRVQFILSHGTVESSICINNLCERDVPDLIKELKKVELENMALREEADKLYSQVVSLTKGR